jgi:hypothetical protein
VEASGKASFTPNSPDQASQSGGQASGRSSEEETTGGSKRGTRPSRSLDDGGK